jgi:hypothetical protein
MKTTIPCKITYSKQDNCWYVESPGFYDGILTYGSTIDPGLAFALWLRNARISHNMTLADVADKMGVKYQVYQKLELIFNEELVTV